MCCVIQCAMFFGLGLLTVFVFVCFCLRNVCDLFVMCLWRCMCFCSFACLCVWLLNCESAFCF